MVIIRKEQMDALNRAMTKRFVDKSIIFLKENFEDWCSGQGDEALAEYITTTMAFGKEHRICKEISIQKLMAYRIMYDLSLPLPPHLYQVLTRDGLGEDSRVELFVQQLENTSQLIKLTLEDQPFPSHD